MKPIDAKTMFMGAVKSLQADCIFDIGSRDGNQSILFRDLRPTAYVGAFEASPANYKFIMARDLERRRINVFPYAISNKKGTATFYIADPEAYPEAWGTNSLLGDSAGAKEVIEVETRRIDDFVLEHVPDARRIALWIDVESAEYEVLEGITKIADRIMVVHTEVETEPVRPNQKVLSHLTELMKSHGFILSGGNLEEGRVIGDVVYISEKARQMMGISYAFCLARARFYWHLPIGRTAVYLKQRFNPLYRFLRQVYIRFAS